MKKNWLYGTVCILIALFVILPSVLGYIGVVFPNDFSTYEGTLEDGDEESFTSIDEDIIYWTGEQSGIIYIISVATFFEQKSNVGGDNFVICNLKLAGGGDVDIAIYYYGGGVDYFEEDASGSYHTRYWEIDDNKCVSQITFYNLEYWVAGVLYINYLGAHYGLS
ncbi:MAG: hypothetical protein ACFFFB_19515 [Candidatus Heimdallarchaeota archaeon]